MVKSKKLMSIVLALTMLCTIFGNFTAFALPTTARNTYYFAITAKDEDGVSVDNCSVTIDASSFISASGKTDGQYISPEAQDSTQMTISITSVPDGYTTPSDISFTVESLNSSSFSNTAEWTYNGAISERSNGYSFTCTLKKSTAGDKTDEDNTETVAHTHAICGETTCTTDHDKNGEADNCTSVTYQPLSEALKDYYDAESDTYKGSTPEYKSDSLYSYNSVLPAGNYYLDKDMTLSTPLYLPDNTTINLCLNGHKLVRKVDEFAGPAIFLDTHTVLNLSDCNSGNNQYRFKKSGSIWEEDASGEYTVTGGVITGSTVHGTTFQTALGHATGIATWSTINNGTLNLYGGNIIGNGGGEWYSRLQGHGISVTACNLYGGTIQGNYGDSGTAVAAGTFRMYDGLIANNYSSGDTPCAVSIGTEGYMYGGRIENNNASGVIVEPCKTFTMLNGTITGNKIGVQHYRYDKEDLLSNFVLGASGNTGTILIDGNKSSNLIVTDGKHVTVSDMSADSKIGITSKSSLSQGDSIEFADGGVAQIDNFNSDNSSYTICANGNNDGLVLKYEKSVYVHFNSAYEGKKGVPYIYTEDENEGTCQKSLEPTVSITLKDKATEDTTNATTASWLTAGHSYEVTTSTSNDSAYKLKKENMVLTVAEDGTLSLDDKDGGMVEDTSVYLNVDTEDGAYEAHTYTLTTDVENEYVAHASFDVKSGSYTVGAGYLFNSGATPQTITLYRLKKSASGTPLNYTTVETDTSKLLNANIYGDAAITDGTTETTLKLTGKTYQVALEAEDGLDCIVTTSDGAELWKSTDADKPEPISMRVSSFYKVHFKNADGEYSDDPEDMQTFFINTNNQLYYDGMEDNDGVAIDDVTTAESLRITLKDTRTYAVQIPSTFVGGTVTANKETAKAGETVTLTVTPDKYYKLATLTATDQNGNDLLHPETEIALLADNTSQTYTFQMPAGAVTVSATFEINSSYTVKAVVNGATADKDADKAGTQVNAGDTVKIDVVVAGGDYTNAGWSMIYDSTKFDYVNAVTNSDYEAVGVITLDETQENVLAGTIEGSGAQTDEFTDGIAIVTYVFTAKAPAQNKDVTGTFKVTSAYADDYEMAKTDDKTPAKTENASVDIVLIQSSTDEDGEVVTPAGTFEDATKVYNAEKQSGNVFVPADQFANATVTYAAAEDGTEVEDMSTLTFKKSLPSWQNVGTYTYYVKVSGAGLATMYDSATLTITPKQLTPNASFAVDPTAKKVVFVPTLEGALDDTHSGTVTVTWTDKTGTQTEELQASDFEHDGETTSKYKGSVQFEVTAATSGEFTVTLTYNANETADNYTGETNTATVEVDKTTATDDIVAAVKAAITNEYLYDSEEHKLTIADLSEIADGNWTVASKTDAYDETEDPSVTNVGDDRLVKVVFEDGNAFYNDIVVYVTLKVNPRNITITINDNDKVMGEDDPTPLTTGTITVYDEETEAVTEGLNENELFGTDDLDIDYERAAGEEVGTYEITANFVPNDNYNVTVVTAEFEITAPTINPEDPTAKVKIEVVDLSNEEDGTPDYVAGLRMILIYTDLNKVFYGYSETQNAATAEKFYDVTDAGYQYVSHDAFDENGKLTAVTTDDHAYKHVYGLVVDKLTATETGAELEALYRANVVFLSSDLADAPADIEYDANINLSQSLDVNDYSMTNGIYHRNESYGRKETIVSMLKADYNHDKVVDTKDAAAVKAAVDERQ